jgi:hypothetical protein
MQYLYNMLSVKVARELALAFDEVTEAPHFEIFAFKVNKRIFASLDEKKKRMMVKLTEIDQDVYCTIDKEIIYPVPGGWGKQGATYIELTKINKALLKDALISAYCSVAPKKLADKYRID